MCSRSLRLLLAFTISVTIACSLAAQETDPATEQPANAEMTYFDLRRSKDNRTKQFAERYFNLVKPQEWTSKTGSSKITAKYLAHDPDLKWVKLAATRGGGAGRTVREITVEVAKLNAASQSRVRQIDVLQKRLDELVVEEKERQEEEDDTETRGGYGEEGMSRGREMESQRGAPDGRYGGEADAASTSDSAGYEQPAAAIEPTATEVPDGSDDPDPLGFGELEGELAQAAAAGVNAEATVGGRTAIYGRASADAATAGQPVDRTQWATSYAAFHANFTAASDAQSGQSVDWGELADLRQMNDAAYAALRDRSDPNNTEISDRIGEVQWEAAFEGLGESKEGRREVRFSLPPLPPPLFLRFVADEREAGAWSALRPGEPVRFAGRFEIKRPGEILVVVRKVD
jgi:hypothetical protein